MVAAAAQPGRIPTAASGIRSTGRRGLRGTIWARLGSNQRPLACEASALPLSYAPGRDDQSRGRVRPYRATIASISTSAPFGSEATPMATRAGGSAPSKNEP
jgi:hypothetical protein